MKATCPVINFASDKGSPILYERNSDDSYTKHDPNSKEIGPGDLVGVNLRVCFWHMGDKQMCGINFCVSRDIELIEQMQPGTVATYDSSQKAYVDAQEQSDGDLPGFAGRLRFRARSGTVFPFRILTQLTGILGISGNLLVNNLVSSATQADGINLHGYVRDARITNSASPCSGRYRVGAAWLLLQLISRAFPEN